MAFTGVAVITQLSDTLFAITGLSLAAGAAGTIGLVGGAGEVDLPAPEWGPYVNGQGVACPLNLAVRVGIEYADAAATTTEPVSVTKAGAGVADFLATLTNRDAAASGALTIYVEFH